MKIIIEIPDEIYMGTMQIKESRGISSEDVIQIPLERISNGTVLSDNPTNGEVIQALFPNIYEGFSNVIDLNLWWNAKYKAKEQDEC